jgi:hypothetical protein
MAIAPIAPLQSAARNLSALDSLLSRGGATFDNAIQNAVQVGRDLANKQAQQERNFLTEQRRGINLEQRRAENLRQDFEDDRAFNEGVRRFDLGFERSGEQFDLRREDLQTGRNLTLRRDIEDRAFRTSEREATQQARSNEFDRRAALELPARQAEAAAEADSTRQAKVDDEERQTLLALLAQSDDPQGFVDQHVVGNPLFSTATQSLISRRLSDGEAVDVAEIQKRDLELRTAQNTVTTLEAKAESVGGLEELDAGELARYNKAKALLAQEEDQNTRDGDNILPKPKAEAPNPLDLFGDNL